MKRIHFLVLVFLILVSACQPVKRGSLYVSETATPTVEPANIPYQGAWQTIGVGSVIEVKGMTVNFYTATRKTCFQQESYNLRVVLNQVFQDAIPVGTLTKEGNRMTFNNRFTGEKTVFQRLDTLPEPCLTIDKAKAKDPAYNFEAFWNLYDETYPFFELREVDWQSQYDKYVSQVDEYTTGTQLQNIFEEMLKDFNDCGVFQVRYNSEEIAYEFPKEWVTIRSEVPRTVQKNYLAQGQWTKSGRLLYGKLNNRVGYLHIQNLSRVQGEENDQGLTDELDTAITALSGVNSLVIDLRSTSQRIPSNYALLLATYFTEWNVPAYTRQVRAAAGSLASNPLIDLDPVEIQADPERPTFTRQIFVLTSPLMRGGVEKFVMMMNNLPYVTLVGMPTAGCPSDSAYMQLPNGMVVGIPFEIIKDPNGMTYDKTGIIPDISIPMSMDDWIAGRDPMIEEVLRGEN